MKEYTKDSKIQCPICYKDCGVTSIKRSELIAESDNAGTLRIPYAHIVNFRCLYCDTKIEHTDVY